MIQIKKRNINSVEKKKIIPAPIVDPMQTDLLALLFNFRTKEAASRHIPPYQIFNEKTMVTMASCRPMDLEHISRIDGFDENKIKEFGESIANLIHKFCETKEIQGNNFPGNIPKKEINLKISKKIVWNLLKLKNSKKMNKRWN